jgi:hypothetical protein
MPASNKEKPPWLSHKLWFAVLGIGLLLALALTHTVEVEATHITAIVGALIFGRAWEGAAARRVE